MNHVPSNVSREFDSRVDQFDAMWHGGTVPLIDDFLPPEDSAILDGPQWRNLLAELIMIDLEFRWRRDAELLSASADAPLDCAEAAQGAFPQRPRLEDYVQRYPQLGRLDDLPTELIADEYRVRRRWGDQPTHESYLKRFHRHGHELQVALQQIDTELPRAGQPPRLQLRCPHCNVEIQRNQGATVTDVRCPSCGSRFDLVDDEAGSGNGLKPTTVGHFELLEKLGSGSFGTVWKARDRELDRIVAVKLPRRTQLDDTQAEQFLREARVVAQLHHPNIVGVHEVGRDGETVFIVTDFVVGKSLCDWLVAQRPSFSETSTLCAKIADALHHAHQAGVVHRDLKPQNILVDQSGEPKLTDFGLARRETGEVTMTIDGQVLGTPAYMSPELAQGQSHQADGRTDVYSLGVILFQMMTGEMPFRGSVHMLLHQVIHDEVPHPRRLNGHVPRDLETICLKCLEKSAKNRYPSAQQLADDLRRFLRGEPIQARAITRVEQAWRWCRRYPTIAFVVAIVVLIAIVGPLVALNQARLAGKEAAARKESRRRLYVADMVVAQQAWEAANVGRVRELITRHIPGPGETDLRGFQWYYLWRICKQIDQVPTLRGHNGAIWALAFSPDNKTLASGSLDGTIMLWDVPAQKQRGTLAVGSSASLYTLAFSPDGTTLVSLGATANGGEVLIWDAQTMARQRTLRAEVPITSGAYSPDGKTLAWGDLAGAVYACDLEASDPPEALHGQHARWVTSMAFSPDGRTLVTGSSDCQVNLWDMPTRTLRHPLTGHESWARAVAVSPDGKSVASVGQDKTVRLWDLQSGQPKHTMVQEGRLWSVAFSPDGGTLVTAGSDGRVRFWDVAQGREKYRLIGHDNPSVLAVTWSSDGKTVASAGADAQIKLWDVTQPVAQDTLIGHDQPLTSLAMSQDGATLASSAFDRTIKLWDTPTGTLLHTFLGHTGLVPSVAISSDGATLASAGDDNMLKLWDVKTGTELKPPLAGHGPSSIMSVAFSPDDNMLASAAWDGTIKLWDLETRREWKTFLGHHAIVWSLAFSPDGKMLASAGWADATVRLWNVDSGESTILPDHTRSVYSVAFSPDGTMLASGSEDTTVKLWDLATSKAIRTLRGHAGEVRSVAFSPDGKTLASGSNDTTIKLWYLGTDREPETLTGHKSAVAAVVFSQDGLVLASASEDNTIKLWRRSRESKVRSTVWLPHDDAMND